MGTFEEREAILRNYAREVKSVKNELGEDVCNKIDKLQNYKNWGIMVGAVASVIQMGLGAFYLDSRGVFEEGRQISMCLDDLLGFYIYPAINPVLSIWAGFKIAQKYANREYKKLKEAFPSKRQEMDRYAEILDKGELVAQMVTTGSRFG